MKKSYQGDHGGYIISRKKQKKGAPRNGKGGTERRGAAFGQVRCDTHGRIEIKGATGKFVNCGVPRTRKEKYLLGCPLCIKAFTLIEVIVVIIIVGIISIAAFGHFKSYAQNRVCMSVHANDPEYKTYEAWFLLKYGYEVKWGADYQNISFQQWKLLKDAGLLQPTTPQ